MSDTNTTADIDSHSRYDFLFRSTSDGVLIADSNSIMRFINPAGASMLGVTVEDVVGQKPKHCFKMFPSLMNLIEREGEQRLEVRLPRRRLAQGIADTLPNKERIILLQDITEKRDIETRRDALTRAIAHDLRNPLSAIVGFLDLGIKSGDMNDLQKKFFTRARQTTSKIQEMLTSLVDLAWIEAGMPLQHVPVRLDSIIMKCVEELRELAQKGTIGIVTSLQKPLPLVMGDPERLHILIFHLLQNAILYSPAEKNVVIHAWGDEHELYCSVADQGIGIADNELELIFDRMYRSRDERIAEINGGGLGLTIAKTIVQRHGGDIWASSNLNVGSTFTFVLPAVER